MDGSLDSSATTAPAQLSPDRLQFWDGSTWCKLSEDRKTYWDGSEWRGLPWWARPGVSISYLLYGSYLGGNPIHPKPVKKALLQFADEGVYVNAGRGSLIFVPWGAVDDVVVEGSDEFRRRASAGRLLAFGALGYLTSSGKFCYVNVASKLGPVAFEVNTMMARELQAQMQDVLQHYHRQRVGQEAESAKDDPYVQLAKLAELRDGGVISTDDFETKKAEILRRI